MSSETQSTQNHTDEDGRGAAEPALPSVLGMHTLIELWNCNAKANDPAAFREVLPRAATSCGATVLDILVHQFSPQGVTGVAVLAESHLSLHSWPEYNYIGADLFTCGTRLNPAAAVAVLEEFFEADRVDVRSVPRGEFHPTPDGNRTPPPGDHRTG